MSGKCQQPILRQGGRGVKMHVAIRIILGLVLLEAPFALTALVARKAAHPTKKRPLRMTCRFKLISLRNWIGIGSKISMFL